jgi:hypothetical protein
LKVLAAIQRFLENKEALSLNARRAPRLRVERVRRGGSAAAAAQNARRRPAWKPAFIGGERADKHGDYLRTPQEIPDGSPQTRIREWL